MRASFWFACFAMFVLGACRSSSDATVTATAPDASAVVAVASANAVDAAPPLAAKEAVVGKDAAAPVTAHKKVAECRARNDAGVVELDVAWTKNDGKGTLSVDGKTSAIVASLWKGMVLVNPVAKPDDNAARVATVDETDPAKRKIQVGDFKQPWLACDPTP